MLKKFSLVLFFYNLICLSGPRLSTSTSGECPQVNVEAITGVDFPHERQDTLDLIYAMLDENELGVRNALRKNARPEAFYRGHRVALLIATRNTEMSRRIHGVLQEAVGGLYAHEPLGGWELCFAGDALNDFRNPHDRDRALEIARAENRHPKYRYSEFHII